LFANIALGALGLALLLLLLAMACNRLTPTLGARLVRWRLRKRSGLQEASVAVQGWDTPYLYTGEGEVLVLLHDFAGGKDRFIEMSRHLKGHMQLLIPDLLGHGGACKDPQADYSIAAQVQHVRAFLQAHKLGRIHLGGNGMGGSVAAWYAAHFPDEVASLWLLHASATQEAWQAPWVVDYDATGQCPLMVKTVAQQKAKLEFLTGEYKYVPYCVLHAWATAGAQDFDLHHSILKTLRRSPPLEQQFASLATPALIVGGDLDRLVPPTSVKTLSKVFAHCSSMVLQDMGHLPHIEAPRQTAHDYLAFRAKLAAAQR
jgi:triacylglycerol lipase